MTDARSGHFTLLYNVIMIKLDLEEVIDNLKKDLKTKRREKEKERRR
jgi:hypothetical protein